MRSLPPVITAEVARQIISGARKVSVDLGLTVSDVCVEGDTANLLGHIVSVRDLEEVAGRENSVFFPEGKSMYQVAVSSARFYKLVPTAGAPTLEIDGVRMHRTKEMTPDRDAEEKLESTPAEEGQGPRHMYGVRIYGYRGSR